MKEEELKYNLRLLDELTVDVFKEIIQIFYSVQESKPVQELSHQALEFLRLNLKSNPVTTSTILNFLQSHITNTNELHKIQLLYLDVLKTELTNNCPDRVITTLSLARWDDKLQSIFVNDIFKHFSDDIFRQHRKQILISLVTHSKPDLINIAADMIHRNESQKHFKLTAEYMIELCYQDKTHWLLKAAQIYKQQLQDMKNVTFEINNFTKQILIMVLIDLTNSPESYDLPSLVNQLTNIFSILDTYTTTDHQLQFYMTEVKRELTVIKFCLENNCKLMSTSIFSQVLSQSALTVISQVCRLSKFDRYKVSRLLNTNNDFIAELVSLSGKTTDQICPNWDISTYNSYCAITKVIDTILNSSESIDNTQEMSTSLDDIKRLVLSIQPLQYCIEVIETLFSCLFLRYEYFSCYEHNQEFPCGTHSECSYFYSKKQNKNATNIKSSSTGFMCNALTTQIILNTLKLCLETLTERGEVKSIEINDPNTFARFKKLVNVVNHSIWKMQLVSTLSPDSSPLQLKLCLDYVEVDGSSEDEERELEPKAFRKKPKMKRRHTNPKPEVDHVMLASTVSANEDAYSLKKNTIDFISIMLAKPNCLVALALYQNDFSKANQILEMFDLSDSEIATEVIFTEQLRHLVAKIKNIICYRDCSRYPSKELSALSVVSTEVMGLVEGFLSSNRAPNSFDIIELSSRHPHLQLYNHQNAPFINAVDILLSSGLNREITYGLINVVERKLAEVRCSTDITAVKKINYIRFVEDIASVTFEIFGNTEKSFDFVDNVCDLVTDCRIPIKHKDFCKLNQLSKELRQCCLDLADIVNPTKDTELDENLLQKYHQIYMNVVAASDKDLCNVGEVSRHGTKKARVHYLRKCYMYSKSVSQLEQEDRPNEPSTEAPYFSVLERQLHDIFGNMINNKEIPVTYLEPICKKLNVNLIPKLILNFCPSITLAGSLKEASEENFNNLLQVVFDFKNLEEKLFVEPTADFAPLPRTPDPQCLTYVVLHNWVLAHIIRKIHSSLSESTSQHSMDARTKYLNKYMELERFDSTKVLFGNNKCLASLHTVVDLDKLFLYMPQLLESGKILQCLKIIDALSERQLKCSANLMNLRDLILFKIATNPKVPNSWKYCQYLQCSELKLNLILDNLSCWPADGAMEAIDYLRFILDQTAVEEGLYEKCNEWKVKIPVYEQICSIMGANHWYTIYEKSMENPENIIEILMDSQQFKLCLEWADTHDVSEHMKNLIVVNLLRQFFEYTNQATPALVQDLLRRLPTSQAVDLVAEEISKIRNIEILQVCIDFLAANSSTWRCFENIKTGFQIMLEIEANARHLFWDLIEKPLLMIEQLLMNGRLEMLAHIINKISPNLKNDLSGDNLYYNIKTIETLMISRNTVDSLLRYYAEKALDMKNPRHNCPSPPKPWDDSLLQSIDSINIEAASKPFVMPEQVPPKEQWVEDYTVDRCMLCKISIFSMIIRRHHCRRCGRLVCHACSRNRMQVPSYPSGVKFRVCDDCYTQTMNRKSNSDCDNLMLSSNSDSAGSGTTCMDWCLSTNAKKNEAVRAEFTYEFTPNVTLCLSIMKMHTISLDYPRFLLDRSDEVARELANGGDSRLLVRARRSLLLAAAELYARAPHEKSAGVRVAETGAAHATRCLAHADAMATLVKHQAHHLVPHQGAHPSQIVRSLLEAEKWELALEIATKSGLPRNSVLAAWGKACLKAGCFKEARRKFALCFKNTPVCVDVDELEYGKEASEFTFVNRRLNHMRSSERSISTSSATSEGRGRTNPPLLNEIISMLEDMNYPVNQQLLDKAETIKSTSERLSTMNTSKKKIQLTEPALNIMHMLASVKKIKQGDYSDFQTATIQPKKTLAQELLRRNNHNEVKVDHSNKKLDPFFYKECVYYLSNYGSHVANIMFYMKHSNLREVIRYCYDNMVEKETFTDAVYMECLKRNKVNDLLKAMSDMDSTLEMWSEYIMHVCRTLEAGKKLDALYALQCGTAQHARASASCALLYARPVPPPHAPFAVLQARQHHLAAALHHLAQCVPVANSEYKKLDALYALQCGTAQHARASASCALLYARPVPPPHAPFAVLQARQHHLAAALHHLAQCVSVANSEYKKLDALYALQCGTAQHARASASCALLYARPVPPPHAPFAVLQARQHHLAAALHHLAQCVPVANSEHKKLDALQCGTAQHARASASCALLYARPVPPPHAPFAVLQARQHHLAAALHHLAQCVPVANSEYKKLDALYALQCGTAQHARASASCALLYARPVPPPHAPFAVLQARQHHLAAALHHLAQCVPVANSEYKKLDALYALQCGTAQHARASASCALLYARPVPPPHAPFAVLQARQHHLAAALHHLVQCVPVANSEYKKLDALYALQCGTAQHARASASCALLYARPVPPPHAPFAVLQARQHHLAAALHHLAQCVPVANSEYKKLDALYALQCGTAQHARASASCALLYARPVPPPHAPFAVLQARQHHLAAALHHLAQCVPVANSEYKKLDALYALQCGTAQHARASASCALLYARPVPPPHAPFAVLQARQHHLAAALHHLAQCVPVANSEYKKLDALYALQCGTAQHARAPASCALLYARPVPPPHAPFAVLQARQHHLAAALHHLAQCVPVANKANDPKSIQFHLDKVTIDNLMTTMSRQMELAKYLAACEANGRLTEKVVHDVIPMQGSRSEGDARPLTLFGSNTDKIRLVALVLASGPTVESGFDLALKIVREHRLDSMNIYIHVAKYLVNADRFMEVKTLAKCIRASNETAASLMSDQVLEAGTGAVVARCEARGQLHDEQAELLIDDICSHAIKISCYLVCRNVSSAYILAARHERSNDLRRVLHEAERLGHEQVRNACLKRLTSKNVLA